LGPFPYTSKGCPFQSARFMGRRERMLVIGIVSVDRIVEPASCNVCFIYAIPNTRIGSLLQRGLAPLVTHHQLARTRDLHLACSLKIKVYPGRLNPSDRAFLNVDKSHALGAPWRNCGVLAGITDADRNFDARVVPSEPEISMLVPYATIIVRRI
jgi:hypothetical protein